MENRGTQRVLRFFSGHSAVNKPIFQNISYVCTVVRTKRRTYERPICRQRQECAKLHEAEQIVHSFRRHGLFRSVSLHTHSIYPDLFESSR